ncbi:hypothetical protein Mapa_001847 [Marchantia paleacea]|nr:hypothetical protein Mapa_001847 [Marchantia paleacea]
MKVKNEGNHQILDWLILTEIKTAVKTVHQEKMNKTNPAAREAYNETTVLTSQTTKSDNRARP